MKGDREERINNLWVFVFFRTHMISHVNDSFGRSNSDWVTNDGSLSDDFANTIPAPDFKESESIQSSCGGGYLPHFTVSNFWDHSSELSHCLGEFLWHWWAKLVEGFSTWGKGG